MITDGDGYEDDSIPAPWLRYRACERREAAEHEHERALRRDSEDGESLEHACAHKH
jgi:hypothetical protein